MVLALDQPITFDEFVDLLPKDGLYELIDGAIVEVKPTGAHTKVASLIARKFWAEIEKEQSPYLVSQTCYVKPQVDRAGYLPDLVVLDERLIEDEPRWDKDATITKGATSRLVVEITSTNWRDDYERKLPDYEEMGIAEYWIVDYLALGASRHIGSPKRPIITIYQLVEGEYQFHQFREDEPVESLVFPGLKLTINSILVALKKQRS